MPSLDAYDDQRFLYESLVELWQGQGTSVVPSTAIDIMAEGDLNGLVSSALTGWESTKAPEVSRATEVGPFAVT